MKLIQQVVHTHFQVFTSPAPRHGYNGNARSPGRGPAQDIRFIAVTKQDIGLPIAKPAGQFVDSGPQMWRVIFQRFGHKPGSLRAAQEIAAAPLLGKGDKQRIVVWPKRFRKSKHLPLGAAEERRCCEMNKTHPIAPFVVTRFSGPDPPTR